jgi:hypothetical protein
MANCLAYTVGRVPACVSTQVIFVRVGGDKNKMHGVWVGRGRGSKSCVDLGEPSGPNHLYIYMRK